MKLCYFTYKDSTNTQYVERRRIFFFFFEVKKKVSYLFEGRTTNSLSNGFNGGPLQVVNPSMVKTCSMSLPIIRNIV